MVMKKLLSIFKGRKASRKAAAKVAAAAASSDPVKIEAIQLIAEACMNVPTDEEVHIKMVFTETGEMMACNLARYKDEAALGLSTTATLVESPELSPCLALGKPNSPLLSAFTQALPVADVKRAAAARLTQTPGLSPVQSLSTADFRVMRILGHGGQGKVLLVDYLPAGRLYALKMIKKQGMPLKDYRLAFQEQDASKVLAGNPWCAQLKASFEDEEYFYLLSKFCPGGELADRIYRFEKLEASQARQYCAQLVLALDELHRRRIMHRDIKPQNVLLTYEGDIVLADFGLTRTFGRSVDDQPWREHAFWDRPGPGVDNACTVVPREGAIGECVDMTRQDCGTVAYMAPEVGAGAPYSYPADVWSLGMVCFEILNRRLPFGIDGRDQDPGRLFARIRHGVVEVNEDVDVDAHDLLYMMLEKEPSRRPSLEQIKEHPWFASIDWDQLSQRRQPKPIRSAEGVKPTKAALEVKFGTPYAEGHAPHPWYQWISPSLLSRDPSTKAPRKTSKHSASPVMLSVHPASPLPPSFTAFFAPRALLASPASPAFFAPPSHSGVIYPETPLACSWDAANAADSADVAAWNAPSSWDAPAAVGLAMMPRWDALRMYADSTLTANCYTPAAGSWTTAMTDATRVGSPMFECTLQSSASSTDTRATTPELHSSRSSSEWRTALAPRARERCPWAVPRACSGPTAMRATTPEVNDKASDTTPDLAPRAKECCAWAVPSARAQLSRSGVSSYAAVAPSVVREVAADLAPRVRERSPWAVFSEA
ncbi:kinase-like domain-containing protein [Trametes gibbosa]|nr:kinase-like domain-containing protein [Trametes gibbosa]